MNWRAGMGTGTSAGMMSRTECAAVGAGSGMGDTQPPPTQPTTEPASKAHAGSGRPALTSRCSLGLFSNHCPSLPRNPASQTQSGSASQGEFAGQKSVRVFAYAFMRIQGLFLLVQRHMHVRVASSFPGIHGGSRA